MYALEKIHETAIAEPDKLAVVFNGRPIAYTEFWRRIEACQRSLRPLLPAQGIAVLAVDSLLAAWILSFALRGLGLDVAVTRIDEQVGLFADLDVACVISLVSEGRRVAAAPAGARKLRIEDPALVALSGDAPPPPPEGLKAGGQILLTSGTTGEGKKVLLDYGCTRQTIESRVANYRELGDKYRQMGPDNVLNVFGLGLWTGAGHLWPMVTWALGGGVVLYEGESDFHRALDWPGITHTRTTPAYMALLLAMPEGAFPYLPDMQLTVVSGGLTPAMARETRRRLTPRILITLSATEGGGFARTVIETDEDLRWYRLDPKRAVEVVDDNDQALPPGELGRLRVRQGAVSGYFQDPETSAKFFSDGWFYPGDLAILDGKGRIALYGRTTDIVHIRGNKYPAEPWERAIQEALDCEGVCLLSGSWRSESEQLHLFIESRKPISGQALAATVRATLSGFPGVHIHKIDAMPRTASGKIRRITLAQQLHDGVYGPDA